MAKEPIIKFDMRADEEFLRRVDDLRRDDPDLPSRSQIVRQAVDALYGAMEKRKRKAGANAERKAEQGVCD